jgi:hypothetical protein
MSALDRSSPERLAELLVTAASHLTSASSTRPALAPMGIPIRCGRLHLGRLRGLLESAEPVAVTAGFGTAVWLGSRDVSPPDVGRLAYRTETQVDNRGRVVLDLRVRAWLAVEDPMSFEAVAVPAEWGGLLILPIEDFARRWEVISR